MCGIIGYAGDGDAGRIVLDGLERLEYRGYDSSGVIALDRDGFDTVKAPEEVEELRERRVPDGGDVAVGHTRWATHGGVTRANAHPHRCDRIAVVHNGIVENHAELKQELDGHEFSSETDSEVIAHFLEEQLEQGAGMADAIETFLDAAEGTMAVVAVDRETGTLYGFRRGSPLVVGIGEGEWFIGSDADAFSPHTRDAVFLEDGEYVVIDREPVFHRAGEGRVEKTVQELGEAQLEEGKQGYEHYMLKEIEE
ncbi:MAG: glutamine--fructose-6-phosphate aminotransferase, partial [Candidatus Nanohaloarchaea archaeon]|nr:glutamine--fructose-6-phosphate aminotransferase [Candidatus Nanohaloarchaea archaeon]